MGWNDHVAFEEYECLECGEVDVWELWDDIAIARYGGGLDKKLGHDVADHHRCPHCGSTNGKPYEDEDDFQLSSLGPD